MQARALLNISVLHVSYILSVPLFNFHEHTKSEGKHLDSRLWSCDPNIPGTERYICIKGGMGSRKGSIIKSGEEDLGIEYNIIIYIIIM